MSADETREAAEIFGVDTSTDRERAADGGPEQAKGGRADGVPARYAVGWTEGKTPKPVLPELPPRANLAALLAWATAVLALDPVHPLTGARHLGASGASGVVELDRYDAPLLTFDPAGVIGNGVKLTDALTWQLIDSDGDPFPWSVVQAQRIARVVRRICKSDPTDPVRTLADDAAAAVVTLTHTAELREGCTTYGGSGERYEAARALAPVIDDHERVLRPSYLIDRDTGEIVVRVSDAAHVARRMVGSLRRGWLDGAMRALGWRRFTLQGYGLPGRAGRRGPHTHCDVYRGHLPTDDDDGSVNP